MTHRFPSRRLRSAALTATILVALPGSLLAAGNPGPFTPERSTPTANADSLKSLPASHDELTFRGENSSASWPVYFSRSEAAGTSVFQISLLNTISLLPERSLVRVVINGRTLASMPIRSPEKTSLIPIRIPPGVLVPGLNGVQISVTMSHRVDCSVKATYELWSLLDRAQTGFRVPLQAAQASRSLDDLAAEPLADDGTTRIHLRVAANADAQTLSRGAEFIAALVTRSHLLRPVVDVGPEAGTGPGFDVMLDQAGTDVRSDGKVVGRQDGIALVRTAANRLLVAPTESDVDIQAVAANLRDAGRRSLPSGTELGLRSFDNLSGTVVGGERRVSFAELGARTESISGRRYVNTLSITLPGDFYAGNYGKAQILLDAARSSELTALSSLVFRVNGTLVSTLPLGPGSPERLDHAVVELPLQFFRPGHNDIELEGVLPTAADEQCDLTGAPSGPRLTIAETSELVMPRFARLLTTPQMVPMLRFSDRTNAPATEFYFASADPAAIGTGLTVAANMAANGRLAGTVHVNLDQPTPADPPGIVIGTLADLPDSLAVPTRALAPASESADGSTVQTDLKVDQAAAGDSSTLPTVPDTMLKTIPSQGARDYLQTGVRFGEQWLRNKGFFFSGTRDRAADLQIGDHSLLMAAVTMAGSNRSIAGIELPQFTRTPKAWLVVSGRTTDAMGVGMKSLVAESHWKDLNGEAVAYDAITMQFQAKKADKLTYVMPETVVVGDLRPILGGVFSSNILLSLGALMVLLTMLGISTQVLLRLVGERSK